jgi:hypothetical protein
MDLHAAGCDGLDLARRAITMPDEAVASVQKLQILYGGEERFTLHLHSLREQLPSARPEDVLQRIIEFVWLLEMNNSILVHGVRSPLEIRDVWSPSPYAALIPSSPSFTHSSNVPSYAKRFAKQATGSIAF